MNDTEKTPKLLTLRRILAAVLAVCLVFALLCFAAPVTRRKRDINAAGSVLEQQLALIPAMISYYDGSSLAALAQSPSNGISSLRVSNTLDALIHAGNYDTAMIVVRSGKQYVCAADGLFETGKNAYAPGSLLSLEKAVSRRLDAIFEGTSAGGTIPALVEARDGGNAACVALPLKGASEELIGVLWVQAAIGDTQYHMLHGINLYIAGGILAGVALVMGLLIFAISKMQSRPPRAPVPDPDDPDFPAAPPVPPEAPAPQPEAAAPAEDVLDAEIAPSPDLPDGDAGDGD